LDDVPFLDLTVGPKEDGAHVVLFEVQDHADHVSRESEQLARHGALEAVHAGDTVADLDDAAHLGEIGLALEPLDLPSDDLTDLARLDHAAPPAPLMSAPRSARRRPATLASKTRLSTSTTKPPSRAGSTSVSRRTSLPSRRPSRSRRAARSASASGAALRTRARTRPAARSMRAR